MKFKNKKNTITSILLLLTISFFAQETVIIPLSNPSKSGFLKVKILNGSIKVKGTERKDILIKAILREEISQKDKEKSKNSKTQGLKRISNNALDFSVKEYNNEIDVDSDRNGTTDFEIEVPKNFSLKLSTYYRGEIYVEKVNGSMDISNYNGKIVLKDISGAVSADALNNDITVNFIKVTPNVAMAFSSLNGDIDITLPKTIKADIKVKSERGEIYTDFDLKAKPSKTKISKGKSKENGYSVKVEKWIAGSINGGGAELFFKNYNGDVIIRANKSLK